MGGGHMFTITHKSNKRVYLNFPKNVNNYMCLTNISMNIWNLYACKDRNRKRNYCQNVGDDNENLTANSIWFRLVDLKKVNHN